jgi:RNA recognition motif. (a.k.a. RRM, RBD, or RNP domain)
MGRLIQVSNLPASIDSFALQQLFEFHGAVRSAMIALHLERDSGASVGFIEMESEECGWEAILALNLREHFGQVISVGWSENLNARFADRDQTFGPMNIMSDEMAGNERDRQ